MAGKQTSLVQAIAVAQDRADQLAARDDTLRAQIACEQERLANLLCTDEGFDASEKMALERSIRFLEHDLRQNEEPRRRAQRKLDQLLLAHANADKVGAPSKSQAIKAQVHTLRASLAAMDERANQLVAAMVGDPDSEALHEDIALNNEKRKAAFEKLETYEKAYAAAVREDQGTAVAASVIKAYSLRDDAVKLSQQRERVAEKIDKYLAGLAPLMREWREADQAVHSATKGAIHAAYAGAKIPFGFVGAAARTNSIKQAVAQALIVSDIQDVTSGLLNFQVSVTLDTRRRPVTAKELAEKATANLQLRLDGNLQEAGTAHV